MKKLVVSSLIACCSLGVFAQEPAGGWRGTDGVPVPETSAQRAIDNFGVWLLVTPDVDWAEKWETPSHVTPHFAEATEVKRGSKVTILTFLANPKPDRDNRLKAVCDLKVTRPDGSISLETNGVVCLDFPLKGEPHNVRLSSLVVGFSADPGDLAGKWNVAVRVTDVHRGVSVPVSTSFTLVEN